MFVSFRVNLRNWDMDFTNKLWLVIFNFLFLDHEGIVLKMGPFPGKGDCARIRYKSHHYDNSSSYLYKL